MIRKILTILSWVGLVMCVVLWPVSYLIPTFRTYHYQFFAQNGSISATWIAEPAKPIGLRIADAEGKLVEQRITVPTGFSLLGYDPAVTTRWLPTHLFSAQQRFLLIPLWMPLLLCAAILRLIWWSEHLRNRRSKRGQCVRCGYDMRGSAERCPECGEDSRKL